MKYLQRLVKIKVILLHLLILGCVSTVSAAPDCSYCLDDLTDCVDACAGNPTCISNCSDTYDVCAYNCENNVPIEDNLYLLFLGGVIILSLSVGKNQLAKVFTRKLFLRRI